MAEVTFTLSAAHLTRLVDATTAREGYQSSIEDADGNLVPNPETRNQFTKRMWGQKMKHYVREYENLVARNAVPPATDIGIT